MFTSLRGTGVRVGFPSKIRTSASGRRSRRERGLSRLNLVHHVLGSFGTNVYVLADDETSETLVIDPGADCERLAEDLHQAGLKLKYIAVTHGHGDHTGAVATLKSACGGEFVAHRGDRGQIEVPAPWITTMMPGFIDPPAIDRFVEDGDVLTLGELSITVIATPGHTPGSVC